MGWSKFFTQHIGHTLCKYLITVSNKVKHGVTQPRVHAHVFLIKFQEKKETKPSFFPFPDVG